MQVHSGSTAQTYGDMTFCGNTASGTFNTYNSLSYTVPIRRPEISYTIACFKETTSDKQPVFDATFLANSIRRKYGIVASNEAQSKAVVAPVDQDAVPAINDIQALREDSSNTGD